MVTAAVLGAAVGVGTALVLALTVLIYRYHAAQKKSGLNRSWSDRDSWAPSSSRPNTYKSTMQTDAGHHRPNALNRPIQFYLPLNNSTTSTKNFKSNPVQPPIPSLSPRNKSGENSNNMSSGGGSGAKRSSPLTYFSLDIPANLLGSSSSSSSSGVLPHQSSLPFIGRLVRTPSTNDSGGGGRASGGDQGADQQSSVKRSPSPSYRNRLPSSPTPAAGNTLAPVTTTNQQHLGVTPFPSPLVSPTPSFSSLLNCLTSSSAPASSSTGPPPASPSPASPALIQRSSSHRSRSPMLAKMNSIQSSTSTTSNQSLGSTTSLFCPPATPTPLGALQPELYKRETTIHVGLDEDTAPATGLDSGGDSSHESDGHQAPVMSKPALEKQRSSGGGGGRNSSAVPLGRLHFRLSYDFDKSDLLVHLIEVRDVALAPPSSSTNAPEGPSGSTSSSGGSTSSASGLLMAGAGSSSGAGGGRDAHVRLTIQPEVDQRRRQSSRALRLGVDTQSTFDEHFKFPVSHDHLADKTLRFQICEFDRFSRPCVIGELLFSLADRDVGSDRPVDIWAEMMRNILPDETRPQLLISLSYLPSAERLTVVVLKAKNLIVPANKENIDPLVKLYLMANGKRLKKKKTECRRATSQPVWNQALTFTVPSPKLNSCTLEIAVVDNGGDRGKNALLGCITLGQAEGISPSAPERQHWQDMAHNVRKSIAMWHYLK